MTYRALPIALLLALPVAASPLEEVVTIASGSPQLASELPLSVSRIGTEQIELLGAQHPSELLNREPGVLLQRGSGQEYLPAVRSPVFTGAGACGEMLLMEAGIALRANGFCNINELFEAHTEQAAAIELIRGPGTVLYGSNALHGVVDVQPPSLEQGSSIALEWAQRDYQRLSVNAVGEAGGQQIGAALTTTVDGGGRDSSGYKQNKLTLQQSGTVASWQVDSGLALSQLNQETASYIEGYQSYADKTLRRENLDPEAYRNAEAVRLWSRWQRDGERGELTIKPYLRSAEMDFLMHFLPGTPVEQNSQQSAGLQLRWLLPEQGGRQWLVGLDSELTEGELLQYQVGAAPSFLQSQIPTGKHYDYRVESWQLSPFARLQWQLSEPLSVTAGARFEVIDYDYDNRMVDGRTDENGDPCAAGCRYTRPSDRSDRFENLSLELAANYRFAASQSGFVRLSRAFRAPQATELYRLQRQQLSAELDAQQLTAVELGWRGSAAALDYQLSVYVMKKREVIFRDSEFYNVSNGQTRHRGIELAAGYAISEQWRGELSGSYARHSYANSAQGDIKGNDMDAAPRWFGRAALVWQPSEQMSAELEYSAVAGYYLDIDNDYRYSGHRLFNLRSRWQLSERLEVSARLLNITDQLYADRADYTRFSDERYFPGARRTLSLGADFRF